MTHRSTCWRSPLEAIVLGPKSTHLISPKAARKEFNFVLISRARSHGHHPLLRCHQGAGSTHDAEDLA